MTNWRDERENARMHTAHCTPIARNVKWTHRKGVGFICAALYKFTANFAWCTLHRAEKGAGEKFRYFSHDQFSTNSQMNDSEWIKWCLCIGRSVTISTIAFPCLWVVYVFVCVAERGNVSMFNFFSGCLGNSAQYCWKSRYALVLAKKTNKRMLAQKYRFQNDRCTKCIRFPSFWNVSAKLWNSLIYLICSTEIVSTSNLKHL